VVELDLHKEVEVAEQVDTELELVFQSVLVHIQSLLVVEEVKMLLPLVEMEIHQYSLP
jgi:hypothetical protein